MVRRRYKLRYMDYELTARELVRALRGARSQVALQRRLKRSSNVLHAWETGSRYPRASDFVQLLQLSGRAPQALLSRFAPCRGASPRALSAAWLKALVRDRSQAELARALGVNRNTVARWLSGVTEPRLPQLLSLVEATTQRLLEFLGELVDDVARLPSVASAYRDLEQQRSLAYTRPWSHAVLRALELEQYRALPRHEPGFIAARLGITLEEETACLAALQRAKQIRRRGGRFQVGRVLAVDTREDPAGNLALKRHWFAVASQQLERRGLAADSLASYNLFAIAESDLTRVRQAHLDYYERVRAIVAESKQPSRVVLTTIGLLPLA
jgi:transcriptional regulator with XRE-family HTH domain